MRRVRYLSEVKSTGDGILRYKNSLINSLLKNAYETNILGKVIPIINIIFSIEIA